MQVIQEKGTSIRYKDQVRKSSKIRFLSYTWVKNVSGQLPPMALFKTPTAESLPYGASGGCEANKSPAESAPMERLGKWWVQVVGVPLTSLHHEHFFSKPVDLWSTRSWKEDGGKGPGWLQAAPSSTGSLPPWSQGKTLEDSSWFDSFEGLTTWWVVRFHMIVYIYIYIYVYIDIYIYIL